VIEHGIEHQFKTLSQLLHVTPSPQIRVDRIVVHHREPIVRRAWVERKYVHRADRTRHAIGEKFRKRFEGRPVHSAHLIAVGNQHAVCFRQFVLAGNPRGMTGFARFPHEGLHGLPESARGRLPIEKSKMILYRDVHAHILAPKLNCKHS
jgi:hypothetical protein